MALPQQGQASCSTSITTRGAANATAVHHDYGQDGDRPGTVAAISRFGRILSRRARSNGLFPILKAELKLLNCQLSRRRPN
jgi:hypothetical protein